MIEDDVVLALYSDNSNLSLDAAAEIVRLRQALRWQDDRDGRIGTHSDNCFTYGRGHYECALQKIAALEKKAMGRRHNDPTEEQWMAALGPCGK